MKTVRVCFVGFWEGFDIRNNIISNILYKHYNVVIDPVTPEYVICSMFGTPYAYCNYDAIRIFCSGENFSPDFNVVDYAIGYDPLVYGDRYFRRIFIPMEYDKKKYNNLIDQLLDKPNMVSDNILEEKKRFCNLIYSHERDDGKRKEIYEILSQYKHVDSAGSYINNMDNNQIITREGKLEFQSNYKFSIAFESVNMRGFFTEKMIDAFLANSIPIYLGDPEIKTIFNEKAFINCADFKNISELLDRIKEIDQNDTLYMQILKEPIFSEKINLDHFEENFEKFICNIFDQNIEDAYRRGRGPKGGMVYSHDKRLKNYAELEQKAEPHSIMYYIYVKLRAYGSKVKHFLMKK